jgi:phenylacetate-coenzyme A ligase PaaK-like adenylate-forming protein
MTAAVSAAQQLRSELLRDTIEWCRTSSEFYRRRFADAGEICDLDDLVRLPVLFRKDVVENHVALRCDRSAPAAIQHTTGTTGSFLQLYRSANEQAFVWQFVAAQIQATPEPPVRPLHMVLSNAYHGALTPVPSRAFLMSVGVHDSAQASQARQVLERTYDMPGVADRVGVVSGTERMVKALTAYLIAGDFDFAASPVRRIDLFGGHVTPRRKAMLAATWHADVHDHYSLTEVFGGASEAGIGGPWIFEPHVVAEAVHPRTFEPVGPGEVGVLLLTSLYPFTQQMPLVRYVTGDVVEVVEGADHPAGLQVRYLGRTQRSVVDDSGERVLPLLLSGPLYEVIESLPDVAISPRFPDLAAGLGLELTGDHHYAVRHEPSSADHPERITVQLGLRYAPWMYPDRVAEVRGRMAAHLFATHPELTARTASGALVLDIEALPADAVAPYDSK